MQETTERWKELCQQASNEPDSKKLLKLVQEINRLLTAKQLHAKTITSRLEVGKRNVL